MKRSLVIGTLGLALVLSANSAHARDEVAYFVLGTIVGSALTHSAAPATVYYGPAYPAPTYYAPAYHAPAYPRSYYAPSVVVVHQRYYHPPPRHHHRVEAKRRHPHGGPPGQRGRGR